jgi:mannose-1-phosphate guanylyltransferase
MVGIRQAFILAGGQGTRLGATKENPKPMYCVPEDGTPLIGRIMDSALEAGIDNMIFSVNDLRAIVTNCVLGCAEKLGTFDARIAFAQESLEGSILAATNYLQSDFLLLCADVYSDIDFRRLAEHHLASGKIVTVAANYQRESRDAGMMELGERPRYTSKKAYKSRQGLVDMGCWAMKKEFLQALRQAKKDGKTLEDALIAQFEQGKAAVYVHEGYWFDIGTPEKYKAACEFAKQHQK